MKRPFREYRVEVARLGLGISAREARACYVLGVPLEYVPSEVERMRAHGMTQGIEAKPHKPLYGRLDSRVRRQKPRQKKEPKWLRDIPVGGYPGMQDDIKRMRAGSRGEITAQPAPLDEKAERRVRRDTQKMAAKNWDPPDRYE